MAGEASRLLERLASSGDEAEILAVFRSEIEAGMHDQVLIQIARYQSIRWRSEVVRVVLPSLPWHNVRNEAIDLLYGPGSGKLLRLLFTAAPLLSLRVLAVCLMLVPGVLGGWYDERGPRAALVTRMAQLGFAKEAVAMALTSHMDQATARVKALASLVDYLPHAMWGEILSAAQLLIPRGSGQRLYVLSSLLSVLPGDAQAIAIEQLRGLLAAKHERLADRDALQYKAIRSLPEGKDKAEELLKLASRAAELLRRQILGDVEAMVPEISYSRDQIDVLEELVRQYAELGFVDNALAAAQRIPSWSKQAEVLSALAERFAPDQTHDLKQKAWSAALNAFRRDGHPEFLGLAARNLDPTARDQAISTVVSLLKGILETYSDEPRETLIRRALSLGVLERSVTPAASGNGLDEDGVTTLTEVEAQGWTSDWASTLQSLLPCLEEDLLMQVVTAANAIAAAASTQIWQAIWEVVVGEIVLRPLGILYSIWTDTVDSISAQTRDVVLEGLHVLAPVVDRLGGRSAGEMVFKAVHDVAIWWSQSQVHPDSGTEPADRKHSSL